MRQIRDCVREGAESSIVGSAWAEYKKSKTVHGIPLEREYVESSQLDVPLFTPSTKADQGEHDENISPERGTYHPGLCERGGGNLVL